MNSVLARLCVLSACLLLLAGCGPSETFHNTAAMREAPNPRPPYREAEDALHHAVHIEKILNDLEKIEQANHVITGWQVSADKKSLGNWVIDIRSQNSLPSYSCTIAFSGLGEQDGEQSCRYNK